MRNLTILLAVFLSISAAVAQTARVQIIHNAPSPTVDIYANGALLLNDFEFQKATPFIDVPADVQIDIGVAPGTSTSAADAIATFPVTFESGKKYVVMAAGLVGGTPGFNLFVKQDAREASANSSTVDLTVFHGSPDAPNVDVYEFFGPGTKLVDNLGFGSYTDYLSVPAGIYDLKIEQAGTVTSTAPYFRADLSGLGGGAATVFASGLLTTGNPSFGLYAALPNGTVVALPSTPFSRVQVIHNSPNPTVDVYANSLRLIDNFEFRKATPFIDVPAGTQINVGIALDNSTSAADAIANFPVTFEAGKKYVVMAAGVVGGTPGFNLFVKQDAREASASNSTVDLTVFHGSPDAPNVDVYEFFGPTTKLIDNLGFGSYTGYLSVPAGIYDLKIEQAGAVTSTAPYFRADLSGLGGGAATVFASGLFTTGNPSFGLFAALPNGTVVTLPSTPFARVQVIHNSPSPTVDVYANNLRLIDDFQFRKATPFINVPAGTQINVGIALGTSNSASDAIANFPVTFESGKKYVVMAAGLVGATPGFNLFVKEDAREASANSSTVDLTVFHGSPDAPNVDVYEFFGPNTKLVDNLGFGSYTDYLSVPAGIYDLKIEQAGTVTSTAPYYRADLSGLGGGAATVFASGLFSTGSLFFGLYAALPDGTVIALPSTPYARVQVIHNSPSPTVDVYANSLRLIDDFEFRRATPFINVPAGTQINVGIALGTSNSASDAIANFPVTFETGKKYVVMAAGLVGGTPGFNLFVKEDAREASASNSTVDLTVFHGSPDAPNVDVYEFFGPTTKLIDNLGFGSYTGYLSVPAGIYDLKIEQAGAVTSTAPYFRADLSGLGGGAATVFASGLFTTGNPSFGLFAALPNGTVVTLPSTPFARVQVIHNSPSPTVDVYANNLRLIDDFQFRKATPFINVPAGTQINVGIALGTSNSASDAIANFPVTFESGKKYVVMAAGLVGGTPGFNLFVKQDAREASASSSTVDVTVFHGSPDAPNVDVYEFYNPNKLVSDLGFGNYTDYLSVPADIYDLKIEQAGSISSFALSFRGDLRNLGGGAATVFASGYYSGNNPAFGLFAALPDGTVVELPYTPFAEVQIIHNSPSPTVDLYLNDTYKISNFKFRDATGFRFLPAERALKVGIAASPSNSSNDAIANFEYNLEKDKAYCIVAAGVVGNTGNTAFNLFVNPDARTNSNSANNISVQVFHGSPDAPEVDVILPNGTVLFDNLAFGEFSDYLTVPAGTYTVFITPANDNSQVVGAYLLENTPPVFPIPMNGQAITIFASGFLSSTPSFGLWLARNSGTTYPLTQTSSTGEVGRFNASLTLAPNPASDEIFVNLELGQTASLRYRLIDFTGKIVSEGDWGTVNEGNFTQNIQIADLSAGVYNLQVMSATGSKTVRFVKE